MSAEPTVDGEIHVAESPPWPWRCWLWPLQGVEQLVEGCEDLLQVGGQAGVGGPGGRDDAEIGDWFKFN